MQHASSNPPVRSSSWSEPALTTWLSQTVSDAMLWVVPGLSLTGLQVDYTTADLVADLSFGRG